MRKYILLFICIVVLLTISIIPTFAFYSSNKTASGTITLKELDFSIKTDDTVSTNIVPGGTIYPKIFVINAKNIEGTDYNNLADMYLRFNLNMFVDDELFDEYELIFNDNLKFAVINDTYYYLKPLNVSQRVLLFDGIFLNKNIGNKFQNKQLLLCVDVDAIQATPNAIEELWPEFFEAIS